PVPMDTFVMSDPPSPGTAPGADRRSGEGPHSATVGDRGSTPQVRFRTGGDGAAQSRIFAVTTRISSFPDSLDPSLPTTTRWPLRTSRSPSKELGTMFTPLPPGVLTGIE